MNEQSLNVISTTEMECNHFLVFSPLDFVMSVEFYMFFEPAAKESRQFQTHPATSTHYGFAGNPFEGFM